MLNRLYIVVGVLLILLLAGAFLVPRFYDWSPYRARMELIASSALGAEVEIDGELSFVLLPQPQMHMSRVRVGPKDDPFIEIERVDVHLALMQFLRDQYDVQRLELHSPSLHLAIAPDGGFVLPLSLAVNGGKNNVSIENARLANGTIFFQDRRSGDKLKLSDIDGQLSAGGLRGPFAFEGQGVFDHETYALRLNSSDLNALGDVRLNSYVAPADEGFSISSEGVLSTGSLSPFYEGALRLRVAPGEISQDQVQGDALFEGKVQLDPSRLKLTEFSLLPDENRAGTRLSGALDLRLGAKREFDAVLSGGVVPLLPRDALAANDSDPYALVTLLTRLPPPPKLGDVKGRLSVDIADLGLNSISLRNVLLDATTDGENWQIENFSARLAGDSDLTLEGKLIEAQGHAAFDGLLALETERLDALARGWRSFGDRNPLFGATARLKGVVNFSSSGVGLRNGMFALDGVESAFNFDWREEDLRRLKFDAALGDFGRDETELLLALLPDPNRAQIFNTSFPAGDFSVTAKGLALGGEPGKNVEFSGDWDGSGVRLARYLVKDIAGARLQGAGKISPDISALKISGTSRIDLNANADVKALWTAFSFGQLHGGVAQLMDLNRPARLELTLDENNNGPEQNLDILATARNANLKARFGFSQGIWNAAKAPSSADISLTAQSAADMVALLGLESGEFSADEEAKITLQYRGTIGNSIEADIAVASGADAIKYKGTLIVSRLDDIRGSGNMEFKLQHPAPVAQLIGVEGFSLPKIDGKAAVKFASSGKINFADIVARGANEDITGDLNIERLGEQDVIDGALGLSRIDLSAFTSFLGGAAANLRDENALWPNGPFAIADAARGARGRVRVEVPLILADGQTLLHDVVFDASWTPNENRIRNLTGVRGQGEVRADISLCCYGRAAQKQMVARFALDGVDMDDLLPDAISRRISGEVSGSGQLSGVGSDIGQVIASLGGEGSFFVAGLGIEDFDTNIFNHIAQTENVLELEPEVLEQLVLDNLGGQSMFFDGLEGVFRVAAGRVLMNNLALEDQQSRLFGGASLQLSDLGLESAWTLSPTQNVGSGEVLNETNARVDVIIGGSLANPQYKIDVGQMVDAIQVKAFELEVEQLEKLRAEQEARAKAQAEEQQRRMAQQAAELAREEAEKAKKQAAENPVPPDETGETPSDSFIILDNDALFDPDAPFEIEVEEPPIN